MTKYARFFPTITSDRKITQDPAPAPVVESGESRYFVKADVQTASNLSYLNNFAPVPLNKTPQVQGGLYALNSILHVSAGNVIDGISVSTLTTTGNGTDCPPIHVLYVEIVVQNMDGTELLYIGTPGGWAGVNLAAGGGISVINMSVLTQIFNQIGSDLSVSTTHIATSTEDTYVVNVGLDFIRTD